MRARRARVAGWVVLGVLLSLSSGSEGRPGGGGSFRSSGSGFRSSGSSYRSSSSSSSYRSSSSYQSSSSSSYHSSSGYTYPAPPDTRAVISTSGTAPTRVWTRGGATPFTPLASTLASCSVSDYKTSKKDGWVLWVALLGFLAPVIALIFVIRRDRRRDAARPAPVTGPSVVRRLDAIRVVDPDFSVVLLEDFLYALYTEAHTARGRGSLSRLAPYLEPGAMATLEALGTRPVSTIVVGSMVLLRVDLTDEVIRLRVGFEANYTETAPSGEQSFYSREEWTLARQRTARSRPPERVRVFRCPNCDAPTDQISGRTCGYCGEVVTSGTYDWVVEKIVQHERTTRGPMLTGTTEEQGTDLPTVKDAELERSLAALKERDPAFSPDELARRVELIFSTLQRAWASLAWEEARPFLSDRLHEAQSYWIKAYRAQGLRNVTEGARVTRVEVVKVTRDRWFDAVVVRLFAAGLDYTIRDATGEVVGGSKSRSRAYSEYWTLIRSASRVGAARTEPICPQCGAPLAVSMAGTCEHCDAKVNSGEFDWVLSRIEQDEVYAG
jgi:hypothetical protein